MAHSLSFFWAGATRLGASAVFACLLLAAGSQSYGSEQASGSANQALQNQIRNLASSETLSRTKRERLIASAVRSAVVSETSRLSSESDRLYVAGELAHAAVAGAPGFKDVIAKAVAYSPGISDISGASAAIQSAMAKPAVKKPAARQQTKAVARASQQKPKPARTTRSASADDFEQDLERGDYPARERSYSSSGYSESASSRRTVSSGNARRSTEAPRLDQTRRVRFMLDSEVKFDNNVYLTKDDKVGDTIVSVRPGVKFETSERNAVQAKVGLRNAFTHAIDDTSGNQSLFSAEGGLNYRGSRFRTTLGFAYDQTNQNDRDVIVEGRREVFRTNSLTIGSNFEYQATAKSAFGIGINLNDVRYPGGRLINNRSWDIPLNYYYSITPKSEVYAGTTYRTTRADGSDAKSKSYYHHVGARGEFTPFVRGDFSVGYRTLSATDTESDNTLGFQGAVDFTVGAKSNLRIAASRDFRTSAEGQSLTNGSYSLIFSNQTALAWSNSVSLTYGTFDYGETIFNQVILAPGRVDKYFVFGASTDYIWNSWLQTGLNLSYRSNQSTRAGVEFNGMLLSLQVGAQY